MLLFVAIKYLIMKVLLVGFKLSVGNELYMRTLMDNIASTGVDVDGCGDLNYSGDKTKYENIGRGGGGVDMVIDTLNLFNWYKYSKKLINRRYDVIFFISSHTLNLIAILLNKLFAASKIFSHIHDPYPHSGSKYSKIILVSNKLQAKLSDKVFVYGAKLKDIISEGYGVEPSSISVITHGVYRKESLSYKKGVRKKYVSLLGRIERYKGVDVFLRAAEKLLIEKSDVYSDIVFVVGGAGDIEPYSYRIKKFPNKNNLLILNRRLSDQEFDDILISSYLLALPYYDGTQTGNIQVAYYNACPVVVSKVGSLPELVDENNTGLLISPGSVDELANGIDQIIMNYNDTPYQQNCFKYYRDNLVWNKIAKNLVKEFVK